MELCICLLPPMEVADRRSAPPTGDSSRSRAENAWCADRAQSRRARPTMTKRKTPAGTCTAKCDADGRLLLSRVGLCPGGRPGPLIILYGGLRSKARMQCKGSQGLIESMQRLSVPDHLAGGRRDQGPLHHWSPFTGVPSRNLGRRGPTPRAATGGRGARRAALKQ